MKEISDRREGSQASRSNLLDRFMRAQPALQRRLAAELPEELRAEMGGVTMHQLGALHTIRRRGSVTMRELAEALGASSLSTATQMADRLERLGLVQRDHDPRDRRVVRLSLTPPARTLLERAFTLRRRALERALSSLDDAELATLVELTERVVGSSLSGEGVA
ncbi:MAG TPA: MarR family transcriptional regulator [Actinomycetota bacterium]|nr:MarR family transcriptional regulator [Actinomycetota bacterium]